MTDEIETRRPCPGCGFPIALLKTDAGKWVPINIKPVESKKFDDIDETQTEFIHGHHESHFSTCNKNQPLRDLIRGLNA